MKTLIELLINIICVIVAIVIVFNIIEFGTKLVIFIIDYIEAVLII